MEITSSNNGKHLSESTDKKLSFDANIKSLCKDAQQKIKGLILISSYLAFDQKFLLTNSVLKSEFNGCPQINLFSSRLLNNSLNHINELTLKLTHDDHVQSFQEMTNEKTIYQTSLQRQSTTSFMIYFHK